jgi:hypothetical protein
MTGIGTGRGPTGRAVAAGLALLLLSVGGRAARGQDPAALFEAARPALEEALGQRFDRPPACRVGTPADLGQLSDPELAGQIRCQFPELEGERRARAVEAAAEAVRSATLAAWVPGPDALLLFPDNARQVAHWDAALRRVESPELLQLALVHEAAHAVLERRRDLARRRAACGDAEEFLALQAVVEGRALGLTRAVARRLGTESSFGLLTERYLHLPETNPDPLLRLVGQEVLRQRYRAGAQGLAFFDQIDARGVRDAEAVVFARPPRLREWVARPDLYLRAREANRPDLADALSRLAQALPAADWTAAQEPWTPAMLRETAALFGQGERIEPLLRQWSEGRSLVWAGRKDPERQVAVGVIRFQEAAGARAYFGFAADLQRQQDEVMGKISGGACRVLESHARALSLRGADEAACTEKRMQFAGTAAAVPVTEVWVRRGDAVLQFSWTGVAADQTWAERVLRELAE